MTGEDPKILISCGEASGDLHASAVVREIRKRWPRARVLALGGDRVQGAGGELVFHLRDYAVMGFADVLARLPRFLELKRRMQALLADRCRLFVPVDYPGLNLRLAAYAKANGVPVLYYIAPQVWAWGKGRLKRIATSVDFMALILPFEEELYRRHGVACEFVGHPFVEDHTLPAPRPPENRKGVGLLPGSREEEVRKILPVLVGAACLIANRRPGEKFSVGMAPSLPESLYQRLLGREAGRFLLRRDVEELMASSRLLLSASGTATLQAGLLRTPMVIVYRLGRLNYLLAKRLVTVDNIGMVNILLGRKICPEFVQEQASPWAVAEAALRLLENEEEREKQVTHLARLEGMLRGSGGARRVAELAEELMVGGGRWNLG